MVSSWLVCANAGEMTSRDLTSAIAEAVFSIIVLYGSLGSVSYLVR